MSLRTAPNRGDPVPCLLLACAVLAGSAAAQSTLRTSLTDGGAQLTRPAAGGSISDDGRFAAFFTDDPNVVPGDTNQTSDAFVRDLATGRVVRASVTAAGVEPDGPCFETKVSRGGRFVAFSSWATNLAASDRNGSDTDIFVKDLQTGALEHVSVSNAGVGGDGISAYLDLSADGRFVTYYSYSTNLVPGDTNGRLDTFLFDRVTRTTERISVATGGAQLGNGGGLSSVSDDGRFVAFEAWSGDLGLQGGQAIALRDRLSGTTRVLNVGAAGVVWHAERPRIAGDGSLVAFRTRFGMVPADTNFQFDVYAVGTRTGAFEWISAPPQGLSPSRGYCSPAAVSRDGRFVAFSSDGVFDANDSNRAIDAFVHDRARQRTERVSVGLGGQDADAVCTVASLSGDGRFAVFGSEATNLVVGDSNGVLDVFVRDRCATAVVRNYGQGLAGTAGVVPALGLAGTPSIGTVPSLAMGNSARSASATALVIGLQRAAIPTPWQGTLLVAPLDVRVFPIPSTGLVVPFPIPNDIDLCGVEVRLQSLVADPGAVAGVAFSRGLELVVGG